MPPQKAEAWATFQIAPVPPEGFETSATVFLERLWPCPKLLQGLLAKETGLRYNQGQQVPLGWHCLQELRHNQIASSPLKQLGQMDQTPPPNI